MGSDSFALNGLYHYFFCLVNFVRAKRMEYMTGNSTDQALCPREL